MFKHGTVALEFQRGVSLFQFGRTAITDGKKPAPKKDPFAKFFNPLEKLTAFDIDLFGEKDLTKERVAALQALKDRIEKLLALAPK